MEQRMGREQGEHRKYATKMGQEGEKNCLPKFIGQPAEGAANHSTSPADWSKFWHFGTLHSLRFQNVSAEPLPLKCYK